MKEYTTHSPKETRNVGLALAADLQGGDIILLYGDLGAGKTTFVKGVASGLGVTDPITSPTFTLMNVYPIHTNDPLHTLVHIDTYRLDNERQLIDIGVEDYLGDSATVCIIEWPEKIPGLVPTKRRFDVSISHHDQDVRQISIQKFL